MQRCETLRLHDFDDRLPQQLEDRDKRHGNAHPPLFGIEKLTEIGERSGFHARQNLRHPLPHGQRFALHVQVGKHLGPLEHVVERHQEFLHRYVRQLAGNLPFRRRGICYEDVTLEARQFVDIAGCLLEPLVLLQPPHEFGARIFLVLVVRAFRTGQQHARLDLGQHRRHQQVFAGELELQLLHHFDVLHVLLRDLRDRDVEDVDVLTPNQVQQEIERTLERLEEYLQRVRRYVQILRQRGNRLAGDYRKRHLRLGGRLALVLRRLRRILRRQDLKIWFHEFNPGLSRVC